MLTIIVLRRIVSEAVSLFGWQVMVICGLKFKSSSSNSILPKIAGILPRMFPDDLSMRGSHETIYTALYAMPRGELRAELLSTLRQARKARRPRARGEDRRGELPNMVSIHQRPPEIDERVIPGH
jgi:IS30 family transposase